MPQALTSDKPLALCCLCLIVSVGLCQSKTTLYTDFQALLDSAYIVGELNVYLGLISADRFHPKSIMNPHGEHGSDLSSRSIFGEGPYSGLEGVFSPFNWECAVPPRIFKGSVFVAYLTENENITPRVSTYSLVGFLYDSITGK